MKRLNENEWWHPEPIPRDKNALSLLIFRLKEGEGIYFSPDIHGRNSNGHWIEKRVEGQDYIYISGFTKWNREHLETDEDVEQFAENILKDTNLKYYNIQAIQGYTKHRREPEEDDQALGSYEINGPDPIEPQFENMIKKSKLKALIKEIVKEAVLQKTPEQNHEFDDGRSSVMKAVNVGESHNSIGTLTIGDIVKVGDLLGPDSGKIGRIVKTKFKQTNGGLIPDEPGAYKPQEKGWISVKFEDGQVASFPRNRLKRVSSQVKEKITPDGRYSDDMENQAKSNRMMGMKESLSEKAYWMCTNKDNMAGSQKSNDIKKLLQLAKTNNYDEFAIYKNLPQFHSTTQFEYLIFWYDSSNVGYYSNMAKKQPKLLKKRIVSLESMNEESSSGAAGAYSTPFAFSRKSKDGSPKAIAAAKKYGTVVKSISEKK